MTNQRQTSTLEAARASLSPEEKKRRLINAAFYALCLVLGVAFGFINNPSLNELMNFIASVFTRLFSFIAVPIIALALISTLAKLGKDSSSGRIFKQTIFYTLATTIVAAIVGALLYKIIAPANVPAEIAGTANIGDIQKTTYLDHILSVIPNNILQPFVAGNVLSVLLISAAVGIALAVMPKNERRDALLNGILGLQDVLFMLIKWIIAALLNGILGLQDVLFMLIKWIIAVLPIGIMGFTAKLVTELEHGVVLGSVASYFSVVISANLIQMFIILPLFLLLRGLNPFKVARGMLPAVAVAFFSKSSAGTLPVTMASAENNCGVNPKVARFVLPICTTRGMLPAVAVAFFSKSSAGTLPVTMASAENNCGVNPKVARFVLPICTTINMNGCAGFILITSLFLMQNAGIEITTGTVCGVNPKVARFVLPICTTINMNGCAGFILITSLFLMQNAGIEITTGTVIAWIFIATIAAVGNAGVPMGCYFLTISLLSSMNVPVLLMGIILPVYAVIDMIETAVNVWSDATVANIVNKDLEGELEKDQHQGDQVAV